MFNMQGKKKQWPTLPISDTIWMLSPLHNSLIYLSNDKFAGDVGKDGSAHVIEEARMKLDYLVGRPDCPESRENEKQRERNPWSIGRQKRVAFAGLVSVCDVSAWKKRDIIIFVNSAPPMQSFSYES